MVYRQLQVRLVAILALVMLALVGSTAHAHLMRAGRGTINVVDDKAYIVVSVPVAAFRHSDAAAAVSDGALSTAELKANEEALREATRLGLQVETGGQPASFETILLNLPTGYGHDPQQGEDLIVMIVAKLQGEPEPISFASTLWAEDSDGLTMKTSVTTKGRVVRSEIGMLTPDVPNYGFFATTQQVFVASAQRGLAHFAGGLDHLLFLIVVLIGSLERRRWACLIGCFTAACITAMSASALGWVTVSGPWVEVVIAGSIVVFATSRLIHHRPSLAVEALGVFGFGLFHGFGFMAASPVGVSLGVVKIAGFNVGVGLGQLLIATMVWGVVLAIGRVFGAKARGATLQGVFGVACALGLWWTYERVETSIAPAAVDHATHAHAHVHGGA